MSGLDVEKFRKVHVMMTRGATEGERSAARARAEDMAANAGLSLADAIGRLDAGPAPARTKSFFEEMDDAMEARHPGQSAERAAWEAERQKEREELKREALKEFGDEDAVWSETEQERILRETLEPLADWGRYANAGIDPGGLYIKGYAGWTVREPTEPLWDALRRAYPFPDALAGVWSELQEWERLADIRSAFSRDYSHPVHVRAREAALEHLMDTLACSDRAGFSARLEWLEALNERGFTRDQEEDAALIASLRADFDKLSQDRSPSSERASRGVDGRRPGEPMAAYVARFFCGSSHPNSSEKQP